METNIKIAKFWTRVGALAIDCLIIGIIGYIVAASIQDFLVSIHSYGLLIGFAITVAYQSIFNSKIANGQTPGKRLMKIQVVDGTGSTIDLRKSLLRAFILCFAFFSANITIPGLPDNNVVKLIKTVVLAIVVIGIVVFYIFNKQNRQSLHDLLTGTYVATTDRTEESVLLPKTTKTPFYAVTVISVLFIGFAVYVVNWNAPNLQNILNVQSKVSEIDGVLKAHVIKKTSRSNNSKTLAYEVHMWVKDLPDGALEKEIVIQNAVKTVLENTNNIDSFDIIRLSLIREFNIGIASQRTTKTIALPPDKWREKLE